MPNQTCSGVELHDVLLAIAIDVLNQKLRGRGVAHSGVDGSRSEGASVRQPDVTGEPGRSTAVRVAAELDHVRLAIAVDVGHEVVPGAVAVVVHAGVDRSRG